MEIGTEAAQFPEKEYINGIFLAVYPTNIPLYTMSCSTLPSAHVHEALPYYPFLLTYPSHLFPVIEVLAAHFHIPLMEVPCSALTVCTNVLLPYSVLVFLDTSVLLTNPSYILNIKRSCTPIPPLTWVTSSYIFILLCTFIIYSSRILCLSSCLSSCRPVIFLS